MGRGAQRSGRGLGCRSARERATRGAHCIGAGRGRAFGRADGGFRLREGQGGLGVYTPKAKKESDRQPQRPPLGLTIAAASGCLACSLGCSALSNRGAAATGKQTLGHVPCRDASCPRAVHCALVRQFAQLHAHVPHVRTAPARPDTGTPVCSAQPGAERAIWYLISKRVRTNKKGQAFAPSRLSAARASSAFCARGARPVTMRRRLAQES